MLLVRRDLKVRYAGSALGYVWTILDPLLMIIVFWFVFTQVIVRHIGYDPYILYLATGQLLWVWFQGGVPATSRALMSESGMVRSTNVPREIWVLRIVISKGVEYCFSLPVVALFAILYRRSPGWGTFYLPLAMLYCFLLLLAFGLILAPLSVLIRDINRFIHILVRILFYMSPVLYTINNVPEKFKIVFIVNPTVGMFILSRATFFPQELTWAPVIGSAVGIVVLLVIGYFTFTRLENRVLKEI